MLRIGAALLVLAATGYAATCETGLWGENCDKLCVGCQVAEGAARPLAVKTKENATRNSATGYQLANSGLCEPVCFGKAGKNGGGCDNDGECVAPDYCICGKSGAQVVGVTQPEGGVQCISLRKAGIKGAFISLAVMFASITFCGVAERQLNKNKAIKTRD